MLTKTNTMRSSSSTLINSNSDSNRSPKKVRAYIRKESGSDTFFTINEEPKINAELVVVKKEKKMDSFKDNVNGSIKSSRNLNVNSQLLNNPSFEKIHNHNQNNQKKPLKIFDDDGGEIIVKAILKKKTHFRRASNGTNNTVSNTLTPGANNINNISIKKKSVRFVDQIEGVPSHNSNNNINSLHSNRSNINSNKQTIHTGIENLENFRLKNMPLADVIMVESYRHFNIYCDNKEEGVKEGDSEKQKVICNCACIIY
jgi:hypothetical protein